MNLLFETERLLVRELTRSDSGLFHEMQADDEVMRYTTGHGLTRTENERQLRMCIDCYSKAGNQFRVWAVAQRTTQEFVGTCALVPNAGRAEIGYRMLRKWFGNGYGQEICDGLLYYGIHTLELNEIVAYADTRNAASIRILDRCVLGFVDQVVNEQGRHDRYYRWQRGTHPETDSSSRDRFL